MSHEIRTPINAVMGYTELLEIGVSGPLTAMQREHLSRIRASSLHLLRLVEEVLDLSRIEAGELVMDAGTHSIVDAADMALALVRPQAQARGLTLDDHCSDRTNLRFRGDPDRVRQILVNLLSNAVKFTEPGGHVVIDCDVVDEPPRQVRLPAGHYISFTISDSGVGIAPEMLQRIFDPFERGEYGGSGLGLSISRKLARAMGGDITVSSRVAVGSTFTLWMPTDEAGAAAPTQWAAHVADPQPLEVSDELLTAAGLFMIDEMPALRARFIERVRQDPLFDPIRSMPDAIIADHAPTLLTDVATCISASPQGQRTPAPLLVDGTRIQRLISERHGDQRIRMGLSEEAIQSEHRLMAQLTEEVLRRVAARRGAAESEADALVALAQAMIEQAEYTALMAARRTSAR